MLGCGGAGGCGCSPFVEFGEGLCVGVLGCAGAGVFGSGVAGELGLGVSGLLSVGVGEVLLSVDAG